MDTIKKLLKAAAGSAALKIAFCAFLFGIPLAAHFFLGISTVQDGILLLGEKLAGRSLTREVWLQRFNEVGHPYLSFFYVYFNPYILLAATLAAVWLYREKHGAGADGKLLSALFCVWCVITLMSVISHEPWFDEIHAWQIAGYSLRQIFDEMGYEGHFMPWFLLLYPFAHAGFPVMTMNIISWAANAAAVFMFIRRAPFPIYIKILVMFTVPFLYINPALARPYVLIPLLLFLLAQFHRTAGKRPVLYCTLLALMANTHLYMEGFVGAAFLLFFFREVVPAWKASGRRERLRLAAACAVMLAGVLFAFLQVLPSLTQSAVPLAPGLHLSYARAFFTKLNINAVPLQVLVLLALIAGTICIARRHPGAGLVLACSLLFMFLFCIVLYSAGSLHRASLWFFLFIWGAWLCMEEGGSGRLSAWAGNIVLAVLCGFSVLLFQPGMSAKDYREDFAGIKPISTYIRQHLGTDAAIFTTEDCALAYLGDSYTLRELYTFPPEKIAVTTFNKDIVAARSQHNDKAAGLYAYIDRILKSGDFGRTVYVFAYLWEDAGELEAIRTLGSASGGRYSYNVLYPRSGALQEGFLLIEVSDGGSIPGGSIPGGKIPGGEVPGNNVLSEGDTAADSQD